MLLLYPEETPTRACFWIVEAITINLMYNPELLPEGFDPTTSEGKARLKTILIGGLLHYPDLGLSTTKIVKAFTAEK